MTNGDIYKAQFKYFGLDTDFVEEVISPQVATYYFNLKDIRDYNKKRIENIIEKMSAYNHRALKFVETLKSHFAIQRALDQRQPLFLSSFNFIPNNKYNITIPIGKDMDNQVVNLDFDKIPHILIAGTTGSGKSCLLHTMISSLLATTHADNFDLTLIDPKGCEFDTYRQLKNATFIDSTNDAVAYLYNLCEEMDRRYKYLQENGIKDYHGTLKPRFIIVDELADLMLTSRYEVEEAIVRLAQKSRAVGMHLILATQRPSVNIISGVIKSNMSCRIGLKTASMRDSMTLIDRKGLEDLMGFGDAVIMKPDTTELTRFQSAYVSTQKQQELLNLLNDNYHIFKGE